ncbi:MAG: hypothetical protein WB607_12385, partial [Candidatus Acidiferrum sp.]
AGAQGAGALLSSGNSTSLTSFGANSQNSSGFGMNPSAGTNPNGAMGTALANGTAPANSSGNADDPANQDPTQPHSLAGPMDASNTIGGNIIGVGSKVNKASFLVYEKAKNYRKFEFIWDPSKDTTVGRASAGIGNQNGINPATGNGANPMGNGMSNAPFSPGSSPGQAPTQNPNQNGINPEPPLQAPPPS